VVIAESTDLKQESYIRAWTKIISRKRKPWSRRRSSV
jgi:hypothetical protein